MEIIVKCFFKLYLKNNYFYRFVFIILSENNREIFKFIFNVLYKDYGVYF